MKSNQFFQCLFQFFAFSFLGVTLSVATPDIQIYRNPTELSPLPQLLSRGASGTFFNMTADEICYSKEFQPTMENWWLSGATEWLKEYTLRNHETEHYKEFGLLSSLASEYLKKTNFKCSIDTAYRCGVECQEVVRKVPDLEDAKIVYFTLRSAQNIAEVTKIAHVSIP